MWKGAGVNGQRALLVEDSPEFVSVVTRLLEQLGFTVSVARDGGRAVALARAEHPDLIVLDVTHP